MPVLPYELQCLILYRYGGLEHPTAHIMKEVIGEVDYVFRDAFGSSYCDDDLIYGFSNAALKGWFCSTVCHRICYGSDE